MLFVLPLDRAATLAIARSGRAGLEVVSADGDTAAADVARAIVEAEPDERAIAAEDVLAALRNRVVGRLLWLRVMAPAASGLGLAGAAVQAGWARHPPGLLALDPERVFGMAATTAAICLALGIAGSTTALGALFFLRRRAQEILVGAERIAHVTRSLPADAWTPTRG